VDAQISTGPNLIVRSLNFAHNNSKSKSKKHREEMQTLYTGCSKAEPKKICPTADPFPGEMGWGGF